MLDMSFTAAFVSCLRLRGVHVGVDAVFWLRSIQALKDPFADALGGIPPGPGAVFASNAEVRFGVGWKVGVKTFEKGWVLGIDRLCNKVFPNA